MLRYLEIVFLNFFIPVGVLGTHVVFLNPDMLTSSFLGEYFSLEFASWISGFALSFCLTIAYCTKVPNHNE